MIEAMPRPRPRYLQKESSRHGKTKWFVRIGEGPRYRVLGDFGTPEFDANYDAALVLAKTVKPGTPKVKSNSLQWLYDEYRLSAAWADLDSATRRQRENIFKHVMEKSGTASYNDIEQSDIEAGMDDRRDTPAQAVNFLKAMRGLFRWAAHPKVKHVAVDATANVKNPPQEETEGFLAWDEDDVSRYIQSWPLGTRQYVWMRVLLHVGVRRGDAVTLGKQHARNGILTFITEKRVGKKKKRVEVTRRIDPELAEAIARGPCGDLAFICGEGGKPFKKESFGNLFKDACVAAGVLNKSAHGLRKLSATIWAERGASEFELMSLHGWLDPAMARLYTEKARRKTMALNVHDRLVGTIGRNDS